jgi:hypothetical protein
MMQLKRDMIDYYAGLELIRNGSKSEDRFKKRSKDSNRITYVIMEDCHMLYTIFMFGWKEMKREGMRRLPECIGVY